MHPSKKGTVMNHRSSSTTPLWVAARDELRARRTARAQRRVLEAELSTYTSAADQHELDAILQRYPTEEVAELRQIIGHLRAA